jgi:hypothetical protein
MMTRIRLRRGLAAIGLAAAGISVVLPASTAFASVAGAAPHVQSVAASADYACGACGQGF